MYVVSKRLRICNIFVMVETTKVEQKILLLIKNISQRCSSTSILKKMGDDNINVYDLLSMRKSLGL